MTSKTLDTFYCSECYSNIIEKLIGDPNITWREYIYYHCFNCHKDVQPTQWMKTEKNLPTGDEHQVLIKRDNGHGGFWIDLAWWRPSANCFDDGLHVEYWCEIPE